MSQIKESSNLLESVRPTEAASSSVINLFDEEGCSGFSVQLVYDVLSFSAAVCASATDIFDKTAEANANSFYKEAHGLISGLKVQVATSDTLPSGLSALTDYFVIPVDADYFQLASSQANAYAGTAIELDDAGTGNQTVTAVALAGASATFQCSNDGVNFVNIQSATSISADGSVILAVAPVAYKYLKVVKAITAGAVDLGAHLLVIE